MASSVYVAGPCQLYVNAGANGAWLHLGMCESEISIDLSPEWEGISIDGGGRLDFDSQFMGATAGISGDLSFWKEPILDLLKNFVNDPAATPGQWANGTIGTMVRTEGKAFGLVITCQYASKTAYADAGAHPVWYFPWVTPLPMRRNSGTRATRERIAFDAKPILNGLGGGALYYNAITFDLPTPT